MQLDRFGWPGTAAVALLLCLQPLPAQAADLSGDLLGFTFWFTSLLATVPIIAGLLARRLAPTLPAPMGIVWMALFLIWALLGSVAGAVGLRWLWLPLMPCLVLAGMRLADASGWAPQDSWKWSVGSVLGPCLYAFLSGVVLFRVPWSLPYDFWVVGGSVWIAWAVTRRRDLATPTIQLPPSPE